MRGVLLSLAALLWLLAGCGDKGADSDGNGPDGEEYVNVVFITTPPGATVYFDGDSVGVTTDDPLNPLILTDVPLGPHQYRIVKQGYAPIVSDFNPTSPGTKRIEKELSQSGTVIISTNPPGAFVTLDGHEGTSPLTIEALQVGKYQVVVMLEGYMTLYDSLDVAENPTRTYTLFQPPQIETIQMAARHRDQVTVYTNPYNRFDLKLFDEEQGGMYRGMLVTVTIDRTLPDVASVEIAVWYQSAELQRGRAPIPSGETQGAYFFENHTGGTGIEPIVWMAVGQYNVWVLIEGRKVSEVPFEVI